MDTEDIDVAEPGGNSKGNVLNYEHQIVPRRIEKNAAMIF